MGVVYLGPERRRSSPSMSSGAALGSSNGRADRVQREPEVLRRSHFPPCGVMEISRRQAMVSYLYEIVHGKPATRRKWRLQLRLLLAWQ